MNVVVVGAGQMGSIYGAAAAENGHAVWFVDQAVPLVDAIAAYGLRIDRPDGRQDVYRIPATIDATTIGAMADVVLFQTKGWATEAAAEGARSVVGPSTALLTLQNGLGNEEVIRAAYPANPIVIGMSLHTVVTVDVGHYGHTGVRDTHLGPSGPDAAAAADVAASAFHGNTFPVTVLPEREIRTAQWAKFVLNCASLPTMALTRLPTDVANRVDDVWAVMDELIRETCTIARAAGFELDPEERMAFQRDLFRTAGGRASMLGDVLAGRRTEIDTINGAAVRYAERCGVPAPLNRLMVHLVKGLEQGLGAGPA